jgi:hypothetical protein
VIGEHTGPELEEAFKAPVYNNMAPVWPDSDMDDYSEDQDNDSY